MFDIDLRNTVLVQDKGKCIFTVLIWEEMYIQFTREQDKSSDIEQQPPFGDCK